MAARHEEIAEELRRAVDREEYTVGSLLFENAMASPA